MSSAFFKSYIDNINRVHLAELIDTHMRCQNRTFRASLVVNPITGRHYSDDDHEPLALSPAE